MECGTILLIIVFLAGFVPQYIKVKRLENDLSVARQENALAQLALGIPRDENRGSNVCSVFHLGCIGLRAGPDLHNQDRGR